LIILYTAFALLTWLAHPLFNLTLFLHPIGRHALNPDQKAQAFWVGLCMALALGSLGLWAVSDRSFEYLIAPIVFGLLTIPVAAVHNCDEGWPRNCALAIAAVLALIGLFAVTTITILHAPEGDPLNSLGFGAFGVFLIGSFLSQWVSNWLITQRPRR
jgi:hypothetical protein